MAFQDLSSAGGSLNQRADRADLGGEVKLRGVQRRSGGGDGERW